MLELTADNVLDYLYDRGWVISGPPQVEMLGGGVSNVVLRVQAPEQTFILKQSRPQLRTRDAWFSDLDRIYREQEVMEVLHPLLPEPTVPRVLFSDRPNYLFAMSPAPTDSQVWKEQLLRGEVAQAMGGRAGWILGRMHEVTARHLPLIEPFRDHTVFVQLRVDPFYLRIQQRRPELAPFVEPLIQQLLTTKEALCHGDYSPKNILTHSQGFTLVDYETAHLGDPTMDLGFFLSHLLLKAIRSYPQHRPFFDLTRAFWRGYGREVSFRPLAELQARGIQHGAVCVLARIDGTSPVDYLTDEPRRQVARRLGGRLLRERPVRWDEVLQFMDSELASLD